MRHFKVIFYWSVRPRGSTCKCLEWAVGLPADDAEPPPRRRGATATRSCFAWLLVATKEEANRKQAGRHACRLLPIYVAGFKQLPSATSNDAIIYVA